MMRLMPAVGACGHKQENNAALASNWKEKAAKPYHFGDSSADRAVPHTVCQAVLTEGGRFCCLNLAVET
eukprot:1037248-Pelagomonas_calceolata.AAC.3